MLNKYITVNIGQRANCETDLVSVSDNAVAVVAVYAVADCCHDVPLQFTRSQRRILFAPEPEMYCSECDRMLYVTQEDKLSRLCSSNSERSHHLDNVQRHCNDKHSMLHHSREMSNVIRRPENNTYQCYCTSA